MSRSTWIKGCWHLAAGWIWVTKMEQNLRTQKAQGAAHPISVQGPRVSPLLPWITFENQRISAFEHQNQHDKQPADFLGGVWEVRIKKKKGVVQNYFTLHLSGITRGDFGAAADGQSEAALSKSTSYSALHILYYYSDTSKNTIAKLHNLIWNYSLFCHRRRKKKKEERKKRLMPLTCLRKHDLFW